MSVITNEDLTTVEVEGTGTFDVLMRAAQLRLKDESDAGRLTGVEYGKVYLGSMSTSMSQAIQFELGRQAADKQAELLAQQATNAALEATLLQCQIDKCQAEILSITQSTANAVIAGDNLTRTGLGITQNTAKDLAATSLINAQKFTEDQNLLLAVQDTSKRVQEVLLVTEQVAKVTQDTQIGIAQQANVTQDTAVKVVQISSINQDIVESQQKVTNMVQDRLLTIEQVGKVTQDTANALSTNTVIVNTGAKVSQETGLLAQKTTTEEAQTVDRVTGAVADVTGMVGRQKDLYLAQTEGFARDAEQKVMKLHLDNWAVDRANGSVTGLPGNLDNSNIDLIVAKAALGIDVEVV